MVAEEFGVEDPWTLSDNHPLRDLHDLVGRMVAEAAREVDELHGELTRAAQSAIEVLEPIGRGEHTSMRAWYGIVRTAGPQIELLVARRGAAYEQLTRAVSTYRRLLPVSEAAPSSKGPHLSVGLALEQAPGQDDDWTVADGRQLSALETVEAGSLRFHQSAVHGDTWLSDGSGNRPKVLAETTERLLADGLLEKDTSTSSYRPGQLLSLTPQGEAALQNARPPVPRVSAALSRSQSGPTPGATDTATASHVGTAAKPSRTR
ncbi:large ATP-binding protein [Streptomyces sp. NPDC005133]